MTARRRTWCGAALAVALCVTTIQSPKGFSLLTHKWPNGTVVMQLTLGGGSGTLIDGSSSWNQVATNALATWNVYVDLVKFGAVNDSTASRGDGTGTNDVFFDSKVYGRAFDRNTLAVATSWYNRATNIKIEGDVVFNNTKPWNSYRDDLREGPNDFFRVALHEFGHVLGLDHPDENGQRVNALMNSIIDDLDALAADDIAGAQSLYGSSVTSNISFPPRNEPNDFFNQLIPLYRDELRAAASTTYIDPEGIVVWLTEYARYRDGLGRAADSSFVDNEGTVVWVLEYLRYRLNGCGHGDAATKVFMQIRGQGIQPVCQ